MDDLPVPLHYVIVISIALIIFRYAVYFFWPDGLTKFGRFDGRVLASWSQDGRNMTLEEDFSYIDPKQKTWHAPKGSVVNGASIPQAFWSLIGGPFEGRYRNASVTHDVACVEMRERWEDVHLMFYEACRCGGVTEKKAKLLYYAVYHFGPRWEADFKTMTADGQSRQSKQIPTKSATTADVERAKELFATSNPSLEEITRLKLQ